MAPPRLLPALALFGLAAPAGAAETASPEELGAVTWHRDFEAAQALSQKTGRPLLILFDEVPGCSTCVRYGQAVLTHPLLVDAAEGAFVPVAIYNNAGGADRRVLESFSEPTWNNPVVRIVDADRRALAPRLAGDYSVGGLATTMVKALERAQRPVPAYLALLAEETKRGARKEAVFSMYCFWSGEACLGRIDGVTGTRTGFLGGREVVEVTYDPTRLPYEGLVTRAKAAGCASGVFADEGRLDAAREVFGDAARLAEGGLRPSKKDDDHALRATPWRHVPMTELQATRANALLAAGGDPAAVMSPRQRALYAAVRADPEAGWPVALGAGDLAEAFARAERARD